MEKWIEIQPGGYLKKYGNHKFLVRTPAEAIKAMMIQIPGFETAFRSAEKKGIKFDVRADKRRITDPEQLCMGKPDVVRMIPKYQGGKNSALGFLAVAAIIAATVFTAGAAGAGAWFAAGSTSAAIATSIAVSAALGGITQLLAPKPEGLKVKQDIENQSSYAFGGPVNTTAQGQPVPVFYGYREVGGAVVSASIVSEDQR